MPIKIYFFNRGSVNIIFSGVIYFDVGHKHPKIFFEGSDYVILKRSQFHTTWRCTSYYRTKCFSRLITTGRILRVSGTHNHPANTRGIPKVESLISQTVQVERHWQITYYCKLFSSFVISPLFYHMRLKDFSVLFVFFLGIYWLKYVVEKTLPGKSIEEFCTKLCEFLGRTF